MTGYPSDATLKAIHVYSKDPKGWFALIKSHWHNPEWGWEEQENAPCPWDTKKIGRLYSISTGGWSGNEDLISAMRENLFLWSPTWATARRGGHYTFWHEEEH